MHFAICDFLLDLVQNSVEAGAISGTSRRSVLAGVRRRDGNQVLVPLSGGRDRYTAPRILSNLFLSAMCFEGDDERDYLASCEAL